MSTEQANLTIPKMSIKSAAEFLSTTTQYVHQLIKGRGLVCPKLGNKSYITHDIGRKLFDLNFDKQIIVCEIVKGGTGKTTTAYNIACAATLYGARVCLVDIDPQGNLTDACGVSGDELPVLIDLLNHEVSCLADCIVNVAPGLDLVPSRIENVVVDNVLMLGKENLGTYFQDLLEPVIDNYDFIIIDCPPTLGWIVSAASLAADTVLAPLNPEKFSAKGLKILKNEVNNLAKRFKKDINYKVFLNKYSANTILSDKAINSILQDPDLEGRVLSTAVRFAQEIPNAADADKNLFSSLKKSISREDFDLLTRELLGISKKNRSIKAKITGHSVEPELID